MAGGESLLRAVAPAAKRSIGKPGFPCAAATEAARLYIQRRPAAENSDVFHIFDMEDLVSKVVAWRRELPRVMPFYAMKPNPDPVVLRKLSSLGVGLEVASCREIQLALEAKCPSDKIILSNPIKGDRTIQRAGMANVNLITFDSLAEVEKIKRNNPNAQGLLRFALPRQQDSEEHSLMPFADKFGAREEEIAPLVEEAERVGLSLAGVMFHVGSICTNPSAFTSCIHTAREIMDFMVERGHNPYLLDIGGGFPGTRVEHYNDVKPEGSIVEHHISFSSLAEPIRAAIDTNFPDDSVQIVAEPGRFFVQSAETIFTRVIGSRVIDGQLSVTLGTGVYSSFLDKFISPVEMPKYVVPLWEAADRGMDLHEGRIWGPTCCPGDLLIEGMIPALEVGDWVAFADCGAYKRCFVTSFNGFEEPTVLYLSPS